MARFLLICLAWLALPTAAQTWSPARDYWSPLDAEGFLQPMPHSWPPGSAATANGDQVQVYALNKRGYIHRNRRRAEPLGEEPLLMQEAGRVYSPSQGLLALLNGQQNLLVLHEQTAISAQPLDDHWQFSFIGERGMARVSTHGRTMNLALKPSDSPPSPWLNHELQIDPDSDFYLKYDRKGLLIFVIRGTLSYRIEPNVFLSSARQEGLLAEWEARQLRSPPKSATYEIKVFAGQELRLLAGPTLNFKIAIPNPEVWQFALQRSSPGLRETVDASQSATKTMLDLRTSWLNLWAGPEPATKDTVNRRLQEGHWEEALLASKSLPANADTLAIEVLCLYRLQQESLAEKKRARLPPSHPWASMLKQESLRSLLRRNARTQIRPPADIRHSKLPLEELYLLASNEQSNGRWRAALDLWERWPAGEKDERLQQSYKEWQQHLDTQKPWSWAATVEIGSSSNVLHLPAGAEVPAEFGHRSSGFIRTKHKFSYVLERADAFSVQLEPALSFMGYQFPSLMELHQLEAGISLPLSLQLPAWAERLDFRPYMSHLIQGYGGLDRFGYELRLEFALGAYRPSLIWGQEQNLDFAPTIEHVLDPLTGEATGAIDRSVRTRSLGLGLGAFELLWQEWDYRYVASEIDDRQRLAIRARYQRELPFDLQLQTQGSLQHDFFQSSRADVNGLDLRVALILQRWLRFLPTVGGEHVMRQSGDKVHSFSNSSWTLGFYDRW